MQKIINRPSEGLKKGVFTNPHRRGSANAYVVKKVLNVSPDERPPFSFRIEGLGLSTCVIKVKKIACRSLKGRGVNSGLQLIYAHFKEKGKIIFIELYHKNEKKMRTNKGF